MRYATTLLAVTVVLVGVMLASPQPAYAGFSCFGHDHYHLDYKVPTKHDKRHLTNDGNTTWRKWWVKKDRNHDGRYRYDHTVLYNCGDIASVPSGLVWT